MRTWPIRIRAAGVLAAGLLLGSLTTVHASSLSDVLSQTPTQPPTDHGPMTSGPNGMGGHQMGNMCSMMSSMGDHQMGGDGSDGHSMGGMMGNMSGHQMGGTGDHQMGGSSDHQMGDMSGHQMGGDSGDHQMMDAMHAMMSSMCSQQGGGAGAHQMGGSTTTTERQQMIHEHGASVMPFDLNQTTHHFQVLPDGGLQTITANDPTNQTQITLIQQHLTDLAQRLQQGDFSEPASLHGADMPGLAELAAAGSALQVTYTALPDGAQLRFTTQDPTTLTALQRWFAAQLVDHATDAVAH